MRNVWSQQHRNSDRAYQQTNSFDVGDRLDHDLYRKSTRRYKNGADVEGAVNPLPPPLQ